MHNCFKGGLWTNDSVLQKQTHSAVNLEMSVLCLGKNVGFNLSGFFFFLCVFSPSVIFPVELNYTSCVASSKVV